MIATRLEDKCGQCGEEINIPPSVKDQIEGSLGRGNQDVLNREYDGFYLSPCGYPYCSRKCYALFCED